MLIYFLFKTLKSTNCTNSSKSYTDHIRPDFPTRRFSSVQRDDITPQVRNCATCGFLKSKGKRSPSCATYGRLKCQLNGKHSPSYWSPDYQWVCSYPFICMLITWHIPEISSRIPLYSICVSPTISMLSPQPFLSISKLQICFLFVISLQNPHTPPFPFPYFIHSQPSLSLPKVKHPS